MLHSMARGESGRIVIEINPSTKDELYTALQRDGMTLKQWFLRQSSEYLQNRMQLSLFTQSIAAEETTEYRVSLASQVKKKKRKSK